MHSQNIAHTLPPEAQLQELLSGFVVAQLLAVAARLGIADQLYQGLQDHKELAHELNVSAPALYRMLRALASRGVFAEDAERPGFFRNTPTSETLRKDVPGSQRNWAILHGTEWFSRSLCHLPHSIRTGGPAFHNLYGSSSFEYFAREPQHGKFFFGVMNEVTNLILPALLKAYDFSPFHQAIDIGGGLGSLIAAVLRQEPQMRGTLFDQPYMEQPAKEYLASQGVADRCRVVVGDFFESVPEGGDLHLLKWIIHDWSDEQAIKILRNCRKAIQKSGRLVVVEQVVADGNVPCPAKMMDILMLAVEQGRERCESEFASLFEASGFRLNRRIPLLGPWAALEAAPV